MHAFNVICAYDKMEIGPCGSSDSGAPYSQYLLNGSGPILYNQTHSYIINRLYLTHAKADSFPNNESILFDE